MKEECMTEHPLIKEKMKKKVKIRLPKRGNLSLKNIFQEEGVPPWMRDRMPLLFVEDELLRIVGLDIEY